MKRIAKILAVALSLTGIISSDIQANSAIYACGHIRRQREKAIPALKNSGYTTAIIFNVTVESDGTLTTDYDWGNQRPAEAGGVICRDGKYVFDSYQPHFISDVKSLLEAPTSISRIEFCIGGWGNGSYGNIKRLIDTQGTSGESVLYRNFKALKEAIPEVIAVNNDQEQDYDVAAATAFHLMLADIGYKTTIAPYTQKNFWQQLVANLNADSEICDLVYLQTYGGGANNNPNDWKVFGKIPMYVGYDNESSNDINAMIGKFTNWRDNTGATGGFIWNYNNENYNLNEWATAINRVFPPVTVENPVATVYSQANFTGIASQLPVGEFSQGEMSLYGIQAREAASVELADGYQITLYSGESLYGNLMTFTETTANTNQSWRSKACSLKVEPIAGAVDRIQPQPFRPVEVYDISGRRVLEATTSASACELVRSSRLPAGIYIVKEGAVTFKVVK